MGNFGRALKLALRQRLAIAGAVGCALMVALLWGVNIGAIYPFVEAVFKGDSLHAWADKQIATADQTLADLTAQQQALQLEFAAREVDPSADTAATAALQNRVEQLAYQAEAEREHRERIVSLQPWIEAYLPNDPFLTLVAVICFLIVGTIVKCVFLLGNLTLVQFIGQSAVLELRNKLFRHVLSSDMHRLNQQQGTDLVSRINSDTAAVAAGISNLFGKTLTEPLKMIVCLTGAAIISWQLLAFSLIICPICMFLMLRLAKSIKRANRRALEESSQMLSRLFQAINAILTVKAYRMEGFERSRFHESSRQFFRKAMKISFYDGLIRVNNEILGIGVISLSVLAGGYLVINRETELFWIPMSARPLELGALIAFYGFLIGVSDPIRKLSDVYSLLQTAAAASDRVMPILDTKHEHARVVDPLPIESRPAYSVELQNVTFGYVPEALALKNVSLTIEPGESVAIVGPNGSGKSTLFWLLLKLYEPNSGQIVFDGVPYERLSTRDLRGRIGIVTQKAHLFADTVAANIAYGTPGASRERIEEAARRAHADEFIREKQDGYDAFIGEQGSRLTGGQQQRIALARAILKNPPLFLLDEATSQIDPESEYLIHESLRDFMKGRTTIMITHRQSTLELVKKIAVLDAGRLVDFGTQAELLARCDLFRRLFQGELKKSA
ncbi:MAG TPA: ABC transporter ATP-binding protein [Pirellulaceae bacterium]|jgi:ATP-binding cassette subfamily B protein/subfamily B ATP-binding cassette protein MsbA|nr:ABC transporter ATP-binding protein [Pirellulaceae bacterium]